MKYYRIQHALKGIGMKYPQVKDCIGNFNVQSESFLGNSKFYFKKVYITPQVPEPVLWDGAKLTDVVSSVHMGINKGFIASDKFKSIIEKASPRHIQFFSTRLHHKGRSYDYWYLHPTGQDNDLIDFESSEVWGQKNFKKVERVFFKSYEELIEATKVWGMDKPFVIDPYVLKSPLPQFFILRFIQGAFGYFVSEKVRQEIEAAGCTGLIFLDLNETYP